MKADGAERKVVVAAKIVRQSGQDETRFFDSVTQAPRLRAWVTLGILVEELEAAAAAKPVESPAAGSSDATVMLSTRKAEPDAREELSPLFSAALER